MADNKDFDVMMNSFLNKAKNRLVDDTVMTRFDECNMKIDGVLKNLSCKYRGIDFNFESLDDGDGDCDCDANDVFFEP